MATFHKESEESLVNSGAMPPDHFHDSIERIEEVAGYDIIIDNDILQKLLDETAELLVSPETIKAIASAILVGHVVLQGPPGTGKSSLAKAISKAFNASLFPVTAHEDWSTFEVIGRQSIEIQDGLEKVVPINGFFTEAVIRCAGAISQNFDDPAKPQATWLLIDELNRAHVDRAFGELFSILGSSSPIPVTLAYQNVNNRLLTTPKRFRIIGTINSYDKQFVNGLSQAVRRRFTFITLDIPLRRHSNEKWTPSSSSSSLAVKEFELVINSAFARINARKQFQLQNVTSLRDQLKNTDYLFFQDLFTLVESVRYTKEGQKGLYLPLGTAQLIDTAEIFITKLLVEGVEAKEYGNALDWAASIKLAPLFETDSINPIAIKDFVKELPAVFNNQFKRALLESAASGLYYVE